MYRLSNKKIRSLNIAIPRIELFLLLGFIIWHLANINSLRFHYEDLEVLHNLYRFENIAKGGVPYITYTGSYGPLLSYFHAMFYKIMPSGIFSTNIILLIISPIVSLFIGYAAARLIFKNNFSRVCFLTLSILLVTYTESWYYSCRVWIGLLSVALFSSGMARCKKYHLFFSGVLLVTVFFTSPDIGIYTFVSLLPVTILILLLDKKYLKYSYYFISGLIIAAILFALLFHKFIIEYLSSVAIQIKHYNWSMGWPFPEIFEERHKIFLGYFRPLAVYICGLISVIYVFLAIKRESKNYIAVLLPFILFGLFLYRTLLSRSDNGHLHFILAPAIIVLALLIDIYLNKHKSAVDFVNKRYLLSIFIITTMCLFFFRNILTEQISVYKSRFRLKPKKNESFYAPLGIFLDNNKINEFNEVSNYIKENTLADDFIYVFPRGPYYYLTGRRNPTSHYDFALLYTREMRNNIVKEIDKKQTEYIINPITWFPDTNNLLFAKEIEDYISTHYFFDRQIYNTFIFKRLPDPVEKPEFLSMKEWAGDDKDEILLNGFLRQSRNDRLKVTKDRASIEFNCAPTEAGAVEIDISLLEYFPFMRSLAKPILELVSYDDDGMVSYENKGIPSDGEEYVISYVFAKTRRIVKLQFILNSPGPFNPKPSYVHIGKVSLMLKSAGI